MGSSVDIFRLLKYFYLILTFYMSECAGTSLWCLRILKILKESSDNIRSLYHSNAATTIIITPLGVPTKLN